MDSRATPGVLTACFAVARSRVRAWADHSDFSVCMAQLVTMRQCPTPQNTSHCSLHGAHAHSSRFA